MLEQESKWLNPADTPLADFPKDKARDFLAKYGSTLKLADEAARKNRCDWELPALTMQNMTSYPLDDLQSCREIANLLTLQCRLEMSEGNYDQALHTLQTGFALARHVGQGDTVVQDLVGIAVAVTMLARVEEMMQLTDAPNLYWALTTLPHPFIDMRSAMASELNTIFRSYPQLRTLDTMETRCTELEGFYPDLFKSMGEAFDRPGAEWEGRLTLTAMVLKTYPDAKRWLIAQGRNEDKVAALPAAQVVLAYQIDQYSTVRDEVLTAISLPPWQAQPALDQVEKKLRTMRTDGVANPLIFLLLPASAKVHEADMRLQRTIAVLRAAEALRWYAGAHDGKVPDRWLDLTDLPSVLDPQTGRGFDAHYEIQDRTAILEVPPRPNLPASAGRRYELKAVR
jgi:hypothetical protein